MFNSFLIYDYALVRKGKRKITMIHVQGFSDGTWATETPAGVRYVASFLDGCEVSGRLKVLLQPGR